MKNRIVLYINKHYPLLLSFWLPVGLMLSYFIYRKMFPFGSNTLLTVDLGQQYVDFFAYFRKTILSDPSSFFFTFNKAIGGEMLGEFAYYLMSPFNLLLLPFAGKSITAGVMLVTLAKYGCAGYTMGRLLTKQRLQHGLMVPVFALAYSMMGWAIANQLNLLWMDVLVFLPLIINGLFELLKNRHGLAYSFWLAVMLLTNYYMGYMVVIFLVLFFIWLATDSFVSFKKLAKDCGLFIGRSILGGGLAAILLLPTLFSLQSSKGQYTANVIHAKFEYQPLKMLSKLLLGAFNFKQMPSGLPNLFVGSLVLISFVLFFFNSKFKWTSRLVAFLVSAFFVTSLCFEPLDLFWHGLQFPVWYPYRFSFVVSFWMVYLGALNLRESVRVSALKILFAAILYAGIIGYVAVNIKQFTFATKTTLLASTLFAATTLLILLFPQKQTQRVLLVCLAAAEMLTNAAFSLNNISYVSQKEFAEPNSALKNDSQALAKLDPGLYRTGQTYSRTKNDGMAHSLNTGSYFSSALEKSIPDFYGQIGDPDGDNYVAYSNGTLISDALLGMKYFLRPKDASEISIPAKQKKALSPLTLRPDLQDYRLVKDGDLTQIYQNPLATTMGYSANIALQQVKLPFNEPINYQTKWLNAATGTWPTTRYFTAKNFNEVVFQNADKTVNLTGSLLKKKNKKAPAQVVFKFTPQTNDPYYLTFGPGLEETNVETYTGSRPLYHYGTFRHNVILNVADHSKGNEVTITARFKKNSLFLDNFVLYQLDRQSVTEKLRQLKRHSWHVKKVNNRHLTGKISIKDNQQIFATTIPYSQGWQVKIDGNRVPTFKLQNTFIGAKISKGTHTVTMTYTPPYLYLGAALSAICLILVLSWEFIPAKVKKYRKTKN
ncbi:bacterial membrane protein YfhO [Ligilactobacillus salitolerans]|uniref:Bacterial membrane protein YfhO n=1 Tax=Ligilactobacillus salitolerans TaxID=1808352 RepID=A0A401IRH7_9LACO|nr:YfhO family protein [Ligilactobacillus salitolerans]GBG94105.1 bacterial membrane protein YfhO [Ligilactobacillus salitolerans]